jgi:hypothetical protein
MSATRKLIPGQKGTKKLLARYGAQLLCVSYRYDARQRRRITTVELIVEEAPWTPPPARISDETLVGVRVAFKEVEVHRQVKQAGGRWNAARRVWEMRYDRAIALGLKDRIEPIQVSDSKYQESVW